MTNPPYKDNPKKLWLCPMPKICLLNQFEIIAKPDFDISYLTLNFNFNWTIRPNFLSVQINANTVWHMFKNPFIAQCCF